MRFGRSSPVLQGGVIALLSLFCEINAAVSPQGVYTHAIPISIPPALAGVGPEDLSLVYNSGNGSSSIAGVGWSRLVWLQYKMGPARVRRKGWRPTLVRAFIKDSHSVWTNQSDDCWRSNRSCWYDRQHHWPASALRNFESPEPTFH